MEKMESRLALCLWICFIVCASTSNGCSELPVEANAKVAETFIKPQYFEGDTLEYNCVQGYTARIKIIYKCNNNKWNKWRNETCSLKRCESPEDIPNGHYIIKSGKAFFFGAVIQYVCNEGYQTMSRSDTRTCRDGGWDNKLPECEEITCERIKAERNLRVEGLPDDSEGLIRFGHRLILSCVGARQFLDGSKEMSCQSNGEWSSPIPKCVGGCDQVNPDEHLIVEGLPDHPEKLNRYGDRLRFSCEGPGMSFQGEREITCMSTGEWSGLLPKCVATEVYCGGRKHYTTKILTGHPHTAPPYKPGDVVAFQCTDMSMGIQGQNTIECLPNGKWDHPYPKCEATKVTCEKPEMIGVDILTGNPGSAPPYKPGHTLLFRCTDVNLEMHGQRAIQCLSNGQWDHPYPQCKDIGCKVPLDQNVYRPTDYFRSDMKLGARIFYSCESGYDQMAEQATCERGGWTPNPLCADTRCKVPLDQHVYRPTDYFRSEMKLGARIFYSCEPGYDQMAEQATCERDGWTPNPLCADTRCKVPLDQNVLRPTDYFRSEMKLGARISYRCESGYDQMAEQATCERDGWTPNPLCAVKTVSGKCGPPPPVENADTVEMAKREYNSGERVEFACFDKYTLNLRQPFSKYLTCQQGQWRGRVKCLNPCTVTKEIMNERGIELAYRADPKMFAPHNDHITFECLRGKYPVDRAFSFRRKCNDGQMTLPECV